MDCEKPILTTYESARVVPFGCASCGAPLANRARPAVVAINVQAAVEATTLALITNDATTGYIRRTSRRCRKATSEAAHAAWWSGQDPFVAGSNWQPHRDIVTVDPGDLAAVDTASWRVLVDFAAFFVDRENNRAVMNAADAIERGNHCALALTRISSIDWALAALIARYGGAKAFFSAKRLLTHAAAPSLFALTPQISKIVECSAAANAIVFAAELRGEYLRLLKLTRRKGPDGLFTSDFSLGAHLVHWHMASLEGAFACFQWRGISTAKFRHILKKRFHWSAYVHCEVGANAQCRGCAPI